MAPAEVPATYPGAAEFWWSPAGVAWSSLGQLECNQTAGVSWTAPLHCMAQPAGPETFISTRWFSLIPLNPGFLVRLDSQQGVYHTFGNSCHECNCRKFPAVLCCWGLSGLGQEKRWGFGEGVSRSRLLIPSCCRGFTWVVSGFRLGLFVLTVLMAWLQLGGRVQVIPRLGFHGNASLWSWQCGVGEWACIAWKY